MSSLAAAGSRIVQRQFQRRLLNSRHAAHLSRDPWGARIAQAVAATANDRLTAAERAWVERIEALRTRLLADDTGLTGTDYGAGSANAPRTPDEMAAGVPWRSTVREICRASKNRTWGVLLMHLVRQFEPMVALELGTCLGLSAAYQAAGLSLCGAGTLVTLEGAASLAGRSRQHFEQLGLHNVKVVEGPFHSTLDPVLEESESIDYVYIDGHHDGVATRAYFDAIRPHLALPALVVFDDIRWSSGMHQAWEQIVGAPGVRVAVDLFQLGAIVIDSSGERTLGQLAL